MTFIDRRKNGKGQSTENRQKFIKRYKYRLKYSVDAIAKKRKIKDVYNDGDVSISNKDIKEPTFRHNPKTGNKNIVIPGNKDYARGDGIPKPQSSKGGGTSGSPNGEGEDEFIFTLTKDEFLDIYFANMSLPNFIKDSINKSTAFKLRRAGYTKDGIPARLDIKKTMENAIARRVATKAQGKKPAYLDDIDIRYKHFVKRPLPIRHAVIFFCMDISASMGEFEKTLAKKFYLLFYLFLEMSYDAVDIVFISHTTKATEVTEEEFFSSRETGGTVVSTALELVIDIINERYDSSKTNIYVAQASDGDNYHEDDVKCMQMLEHELLPLVQYYAYIQVETPDRRRSKASWTEIYPDLYENYKKISEGNSKLNVARVNYESEVYPVLAELFKKD